MPDINLNSPQIDYTSRDFVAIVNDLVSKIPQFTPEWTNFNDTDPGIVQMQLFAYVADALHYYIDRSHNEALWASAILRESVVADSRLIGYTPKSVEPASAILQVRLQQVQVEDVIIPVGTIFTVSENGDIIFESTETHTILAGNLFAQDAQGNEVYLNVREGESETISLGASDGTAGQRFLIRETNVVRSTTRVFVTEGSIRRLWAPVVSFFFSQSTALNYTDRLTTTGFSEILFGDGFQGKVPDVSATIEAEVRTSLGSIGNVGVGRIDGIRDDVLLSGVAVGLDITNLVGATGGADEESIESIKVNAPRSLSALNRGVTVEDYSNLATNVDGVLIARSAIVDKFLRRYTISVVPEGGGDPSATLLKSVQDFFEGNLDGINKIMLGGSLAYLPPRYVNVDLDIRVFAYSGASIAQIEVTTREIFTNLFVYGPGDLNFGDSVNISDVIRAMDEVSGVSHVEVDKLTIQPSVTITDSVDRVASDVVVVSRSRSLNEEWTLLFTSATEFLITGSVSGAQVRSGTIGNVFVDDNGDKFSLTVSSSVVWAQGAIITFRQTALVSSATAQPDELLQEGNINVSVAYR